MADGSVRISCKNCRKSGMKDRYVIHKAKDVLCKHKDIVFEALFPRPSGRGQDVSPYKPHNDPNKPPAFEQARLYLSSRKLFYNENPQFEKPKEVPFSELATGWLDDREKSVGVKSWSNSNTIVQNHLKPILWDINSNQISETTIQKVRSAAAGASFWQRSKINWMMNQIFERGVDNGLISKNPIIKKVKLKNNKPTIYPILNQEQVPNLIDAPMIYINKHDTKKNISWRKNTLPLIYQTAIFTGARPSESFGITKDCLDFKKRELKINKTLVWFSNQKERVLASTNPNYNFKPFIGTPVEGQLAFGPTKTPAGNRILPLGDELIKALQIYLIEMPENPYNLLFVGPNGSPLRQGVFMKRYFNGDLKLAGCAHMRFYDLRHTFCTIAVTSMKHADGAVDLQRLQYLMGHEKLTTTLDIYTHFFPSDNKPIANNMEAFIYGKKNPRVTAVSLQEQKQTQNTANQ